MKPCNPGRHYILLMTLFIAIVSCKYDSRNSLIMDNNKSQKDYFELKIDDSTYKISILKKDQVDSIFDGQQPQELKNKIFTERLLKAYRLISGEILLVREGATEFPLYPTEQVLLRQLLNQNGPKVEEILAGVNIYGENFPEKAEKLSADFLKRANIDFDNKSTIDLINGVDDYINQNRNRAFFDENYLSLIALLGFIINQEYGTKWTMIKSNDVWNPYLKYNGKIIFFADYILMDFDNISLASPFMQSYLSVTDIIKNNLQ